MATNANANPATESGNVGVKTGYAFLAFCQKNGLPIYQERSNTATGEKFKSLRFPNAKTNEVTGEKEDLFVNFSSKKWPDSAALPDKFEDFLKDNPAANLRVVELESGGFSLCENNFENNDQQVTAEMLGL